MSRQTIEVTVGELSRLAGRALEACGASRQAALALVRALVSAEAAGRGAFGFAHLPGYLDGLRSGRINAGASPSFNPVLPAVLHADADGGIAQAGFELAYDELCERARTFGIACFAQRNSHTTGELGYYVRRLAEGGLISIATTNGPALMATDVGGEKVYCTNPMAFGAPLPEPSPPLVIDQASSATAMANVKRAAERGEAIPEGIAVDADGAVTTDAARALEGALLPFGGYKAANIALMVEVLSAGLSRASWSTEIGKAKQQGGRLDVGLTIVAMVSGTIDDGFADRLGRQVDHLRSKGVRVPGLGAGRRHIEEDFGISIDAEVLEELRRLSR